MDLEVDVFSGRENPRWTLASPDSQSVCERLAQLPSATVADWVSPKPLGYRGILLRPGCDLPDVTSVRVFRGVVLIEGGERDSYFLDPGLEHSLLSMGRKALGPSLYEMLERLIQAD